MSSISEEANKLADFILFTQRSCILNLSSELNEGKVSYPQFFLLTYLASEDFLSMSSLIAGNQVRSFRTYIFKLFSKYVVKKFLLKFLKGKIQHQKRNPA